MKQGFTFLEVLVALAVFAVLVVLSVGAVGRLGKDSEVHDDAFAIQAVLRLAQNKTVSSFDDAQYGVYFDTTPSPHTYTLFQGGSYATRIQSEDEPYELSDSVAFSAINLGGGQEIVFSRIQGSTVITGNIILESTVHASTTRTIFIDTTGNAEIRVASVPSDSNRVVDSRHVHVTYGRTISTTTGETIRLTFDDPTTIIDIVVDNSLSGGQIEWKGTIDVGGENQVVRIHTHELNNPTSSIFSIHRDRRFNTKALTIEMENGNPEDTGTLIQYDTAGAITNGTSIYVNATQVQ